MATTYHPADYTVGLVTRLIPQASRTRYKHIHFQPVYRGRPPTIWLAATSGPSFPVGCYHWSQPWPTLVWELPDTPLLTPAQLSDLLTYIAQALL